MGCQVSNRFYIDPPQAERDKIKFALRQATNLWNCLVSHVGDEVIAIARTNGDSATIEKMIHDIVMMAYNYLILGEDVGVDFPVDDSWCNRIRYIRRLPPAVRYNRVMDLIQSYIYVHRKHVAGIDYPYYPKMKVKGSTETMRFCWPDFAIENGRATLLMACNEPSAINFNIEGIERLEKKPISITVTKKRASRSKNIQISEGETRSQFFVSLATE